MLTHAAAAELLKDNRVLLGLPVDPAPGAMTVTEYAFRRRVCLRRGHCALWWASVGRWLCQRCGRTFAERPTCAGVAA